VLCERGIRLRTETRNTIDLAAVALPGTSRICRHADPSMERQAEPDRSRVAGTAVRCGRQMG